MKRTNVNCTKRDDSRGSQVLAGCVLAGFLALVFGACLWTILDATRPGRPSVALSTVSAASHHAARVITASN